MYTLVDLQALYPFSILFYPHEVTWLVIRILFENKIYADRPTKNIYATVGLNTQCKLESWIHK